MQSVSRWSPILLGVSLLALGACSSPVAPDLSQEFTGGISASYTGDLNVSEMWFQGFESGTNGWFDSDIPGWEGYGDITQVSNGTGSVPSATGGHHMIANGVEDPGDLKFYGPFSRFDGYSSVWPGAWIAEVDVYLDPAWSAGQGFDYTVAANGSDGNHQRDYIFHVGKMADGRLLVNGSNNTDFTVNEYKLLNDGDGTPYEVTTAGWYTLQHIFYEDAGALSVDLNLLDDQGNVVFTTTRTNAGDTIGPAGEVGGNRYSWFTFITAPDLPVDNHRRGVVVPVPGNKDDCRDGGWEAFGFRNQGQCIASLQPNSGT